MSGEDEQMLALTRLAQLHDAGKLSLFGALVYSGSVSIAQESLSALDDRFSVYRTLVDARASMKNAKPKDQGGNKGYPLAVKLTVEGEQETGRAEPI